MFRLGAEQHFQWLAHALDHTQGLFAVWINREPEMRDVLAHELRNFLGRAAEQLKRNAGECGPKTGKRIGHEIADKAVANGDHDLAALHATQCVKVRQQRFIVGALPPQMVQQKPSGLCRNDPLAAPFEKGQAELCFQCVDLAAHG